MRWASIRASGLKTTSLALVGIVVILAFLWSDWSTNLLRSDYGHAILSVKFRTRAVQNGTRSLKWADLQPFKGNEAVQDNTRSIQILLFFSVSAASSSDEWVSTSILVRGPRNELTQLQGAQRHGAQLRAIRIRNRDAIDACVF